MMSFAVSLYQKESGPSFLSLSPLRQPWKVEFEEMLSYCNFKEIRKEEYLREAYLSGNPSVFLAVQQYL